MAGDFSYAIEADPDPHDVRQLVAALVAFNDRRSETENGLPIGVFVRRDDEILGGVDGYTHWRWLFVGHLWVRDDVRGQGIGRQLVNMIEHEALLRGCGAAWLDTFSFQAPAFYQGIGYREFGQLHDFPPGSNRHFLWKRLDG